MEGIQNCHSEDHRKNIVAGKSPMDAKISGKKF